jgi:hypothetical protein
MTTLGVILAVVLTFNTEIPGRYEPHLIRRMEGPVTVEGYHFTPSVWNQWVVPDPTETDDRPWMYLSPWLGFDVTMTVSNGGKFNLHGFDAVGFQNAPGTLYSSNGDVLHYVMLSHRVNHYDLDWYNLDWIRFEQHNMRQDAGTGGFDNLVVSAVSEPGTLWLIGIAGLLFFAVTRKLGWQ